MLAEPTIVAIAARLAFIDPDYWNLAVILVPVLFVARKKLVKINYYKLKKEATLIVASFFL